MDQPQVAALAERITAQWVTTSGGGDGPPHAIAPDAGFAAYNPLGGSTQPRTIDAPFDITDATAIACQLFVAVAPARDPQRRIVHHFDMTDAPADPQAMTNSVLEALYAVARMPEGTVGAAAVELAPGVDLVRVGGLPRA